MLAIYFDLTLVISLPDRTDRRRALIRDLARHGLPFRPGRVEFFDAIRPADAAGFPTPGARGCFLSHRASLTEARRRGVNRLLIVEDDLQLSPRFASLVPGVVDRLNVNDWSLAYLGHSIGLSAATPADQALITYEGPIGQSHFVAFNGPEVIERLLAFLDLILSRPPGHHDGGPMHYDGALSTFRAKNPDLVTLVAVPPLGRQRPSRTDIHSLPWFDRLPLLRPLANAARTVWLSKYQ